MVSKSPYGASVSWHTFHVICLHGRKVEWAKETTTVARWIFVDTFCLCLLPGRMPIWRKKYNFPTRAQQTWQVRKRKSLPYHSFCFFAGCNETEEARHCHLYETVSSRFISLFLHSISIRFRLAITRARGFFLRTVSFPSQKQKMGHMKKTSLRVLPPQHNELWTHLPVAKLYRESYSFCCQPRSKWTYTLRNAEIRSICRNTVLSIKSCQEYNACMLTQCHTRAQ